MRTKLPGIQFHLYVHCVSVARPLKLLFVLSGLEEMEVKFPPQTGFFPQISVITRDVAEGRLMLLTNDFNNSDQVVLIGEWRIFVS